MIAELSTSPVLSQRVNIKRHTMDSEKAQVDLRILIDDISFVRASVMQEVREWPM